MVGILLRAVDRLPADVRLAVLRSAAILFWDWARDHVSEPEVTDQVRHCYAIANNVFRHILTNQDFWPFFARDFEVSEKHLPEVRQKVVGAILSHHLDQARNCLITTDSEQPQFDIARFYVTCLESWRAVPPVPSAAGSLSTENFGPELAEEIQGAADSLINGWVSDYLRNANLQLDDAEEIEKLATQPHGQGIHKNFPGALAVLNSALRVMPTNQRILSFAVKQHTNYTYQLAIAQYRERAVEVVQEACRLARILAEEHLTERESYNPENQAVYLAFQYASQLEPDSARAVEYLEECRRWGGRDEEIKFQIQRQQARMHLEAEQYNEALAILDQVETQHQHQRDVVQLKTICYFRRGADQASGAFEQITELTSSPKKFLEIWHQDRKGFFADIEKRYQLSLADMRRAAELDPGQEIIREHIERIEESIRTGKYHAVLRVVHSVLTEDQREFYPDLLKPLEWISDKSDLRPIAHRMRSALHFRIGVRAAQDGDFATGEKQLKISATLDPDDTTITQQLGALNKAWGQSLLAEAIGLIKPLEESPGTFLKAQKAGAGSPIRKAEAMCKRACQKLQLALEMTPPQKDEREAIEQILSQFSRPRQALHWRALIGAAQVVLEKEQSERYEQFCKLLDKCPANLPGREGVSRITAALYFKLGIDNANNAKLKEAEACLKKAAALDPATKVIREQLKFVTRMRQEEKPRKAFADAQKAFQQGNYDHGAELAESIPRDFSQYNNVRQFLAVVYFKLGEKAIQDKQLAKAIKYAERALKCDPNRPELIKNLKDLQDFRDQGGFEAANRKNEGFELARSVMQELDRVQSGRGPRLTQERAIGLLQDLQRAVELTDHDPGVVNLRDQFMRALKGG